MLGSSGYGDRNADLLEFANGLNLVICNALFMKQEAQMVTYAAGPVKSTVDSIDCPYLSLPYLTCGWGAVKTAPQR